MFLGEMQMKSENIEAVVASSFDSLGDVNIVDSDL